MYIGDMRYGVGGSSRTVRNKRTNKEGKNAVQSRERDKFGLLDSVELQHVAEIFVGLLEG
jgi:hypothetical protein